jgi:hypothetical protein
MEVMMKHGFFMVCAFVLLVTTGCPNPSNSTAGEQDNLGGSTYAEACWGEWIRMDADETWYISGGAIKINGSASSKSVSLAKQSDRVIEVTEGGRKYYLYASRIANTSFTGKIAGFEEASPSMQRSVAGGRGWINVVVEDLDNGSTKTTQTNNAGDFKVEAAIPGDIYEITPEGGRTVTVTPEGDGDDVGTITVTDGVNFKTRITENDGIPYLYANGTRYDFTMEITNIGTADCLAATYQLSFANGLVTSASTGKERWGTIEPGASITISLSLTCDPIEEEYAYKKITIAITDEINQKTWEDSVSVKFYKVLTYFYLKTEPSATVPVNGVVINPYDNKASRFQKIGENLSYVTMPWSSLGYLVVFSGATVETEAVYALGVNRYPSYSDSDFSNFRELGRYERNDTEQTASEVTEDSMMAYLHKNDIDYYHYHVPCPESEPAFEEGAFPVSPDLSLNESLVWLSENAVEGGAYTVTVNGNEVIAPRTLSYNGKTVSITLFGGAAERTVSLSSSGPLTVESGVTLKLGNNITLQGRSSNTSALVRVWSSGALEMKSGSKLSGNTNSSSSSGGGVYVDGGIFTMSGGEISGNTAFHIGGYGGGGGVYVSSGTFTMSGGEIGGNTGGGVYVDGGTFTMSGGEISGNTNSSSGGGVCVASNGTFTMSGGEISGNTASYGNIASYGGGVYVDGGTFTMNGGEISGNIASYGGGVCVRSGTFTKQPGGIIYGSNASSTLKNTAAGGYSSGHAVYVSESRMRGFTVGAGESLDSTKSGAAGGWVELMPDNLPLNDDLEWLRYNAVEGGVYTVTLSGDESVASGTLSYSGKTVSITLLGGAAERTVSLGSNGPLFTVGSGVTLRLGNNITLRGRTDNSYALVQVSSGGTLEMNSGSKISGNANYSFSYPYHFGGGVYVDGGTFTMNGGEISGNAASGGGVYVDSGTFTMNGGEISGNTGCGVYVDGGTFTMSSGEISGNTASSGGGVYVGGGTFTMSGGEISGNTASGSYVYGGGVYVDSGTFTMSGGEISGNTVSGSYAYGGGVYVSRGTFTKQSGGVIYGSNTSISLQNTASGNSYGHAVYVSGGLRRSFTVGAGESLDSTKDGAAGGWTESRPDNLPLNDDLEWLRYNAVEGGVYTVTVSGDEVIEPRTLSYGGKTVTITLNGGTAERTVSLGSSGPFFIVESGVTLRLGNNITLRGRTDNSSAIVRVSSGGTLEMNSGSKISDNTAFEGGVYVYGGTFTMNGGEISGNTADDGGGGVYVYGGTFTMNGGEISGNTATGEGGGVYVSGYGSTFTMSGGEIIGNNASAGGGVYIRGGTFTKQSGGVIYGSNAIISLQNTASSNSGHAVYVSSGKKRDGTAGEGVTLDSTQDGVAGGWE